MTDTPRIAIATPGGDAPGMNACIRAVFKTLRTSATVVGVRDGAIGLMNRRRGGFRPLLAEHLADRIDRAGTILGSSRQEELENLVGGESLDVVLARAGEKIALTLDQAGIHGLILIGGDTTCRAARYIAKASGGSLPVTVVPASIDNDVAGTDETIGFDSALNAAVRSIDQIRQSATALRRTFLVEVMGNRNGLLAVHTGIAVGAEEVLTPEHGPYTTADLEQLADRLSSRRAFSNIVVVAEGIRLAGGSPTTVGGSVAALEERLRALVSPGTQMRAAVLGHVQRGAEPTAFTRLVAGRAGILAAEITFRKAAYGTSTVRGQAPKMVAIASNGTVSAVAIPRDTQRSVASEMEDLLAVQQTLAY